MSEAEPVLYALQGGVATLRLNRPDRLNALTPEMLNALRLLLGRAVDDGARAVLLCAEGRSFCSGAELGSADPEALGAGLRELLESHYNPLAEALAALPIPIVSAVQGAAAGAGVSLALGADIIVAARSAYLLLAFANIGLVPDAGATWLVARSAGRTRALEMALLGERMPAEEARKAGLVTRIVDDHTLQDEARAIAEALAAKPTAALGLIRAQMRSALEQSFVESLAVEAGNQGRAGATADFAEGVRSFLEKRPPRFRGC